MDADQFNKLHEAITRVSASTLAVALLNNSGRKFTLKEVQTMFNDCLMIVNPNVGSEQQNNFQERIDKKEW